MLVGTYTSGTSHGVYIYGFNTSNAENRLIDSAKIANPSYLAVSPNEKFVYAVSEAADAKNKGGSIASFSFNNITGSLNLLNQQPSNGNNPCYVTADKSGRWVIAGNYSSGTLAVLPVFKNGFLDVPITTIQHAGQSINTDRQNSPHVHATVLSPDNKFLFVPDLGIDKVMIYRFDKRSAGLTPAAQPFVSTKPGSGPRHFEFHPNKKYAYLVEELTGNVSAYRYNAKKGELTLIQNISTLPADFTAYAGSADIHVSPDGKFLYASNRGESNTIAIYSINKKTGMLTLAGHQSTMGKTPRNFNFDPSGNFLLVANQNSDNIVIFKINRVTGLLTDTGKRIVISKPVCIKWIAQKN
ncbi:MAG TPA: lactonase family protein [Ferruginibacter sp.]|nr:lactonase family protein [Ferruginibacter sp.]